MQEAGQVRRERLPRELFLPRGRAAWCADVRGKPRAATGMCCASRVSRLTVQNASPLPVMLLVLSQLLLSLAVLGVCCRPKEAPQSVMALLWQKLTPWLRGL